VVVPRAPFQSEPPFFGPAPTTPRRIIGGGFAGLLPESFFHAIYFSWF